MAPGVPSLSGPDALDSAKSNKLDKNASGGSDAVISRDDVGLRTDLDSLLHPFSMLTKGNQHDDAVEDAIEEYAKTVRLKTNDGEVKPWYMIDPEGPFRRLWDAFLLALISIQLLMVPVWVAYYNEDSACNYLWIVSLNPSPIPVTGPPLGAGNNVILLLTDYAFMVDILLNFITGIVDKDSKMTVYSKASVWRWYAVHWLHVDALSCFPFQCVLRWSLPHTNCYNWGLSIRLLRVLGFFRRAHGSPMRWLDLFSKWRLEFSYAARRLISLTLLLLLSCHYFACMLWWVVRLQDYPTGCWMGGSALNIVDGPVSEQWLWSFFNVVSGMIGLGYGAFPPITWREALVWVFAMMVTASLFAMVNAVIVATVISGSRARFRFKETMDMALELLRARNLPADIGKRVLDYLNYKYRDRAVLKEEDVLQELPPVLRGEVSLNFSKRFLLQGPLFEIFDQDHVLLEQVATRLRQSVALAGEALQRQGYPCRQLFLLNKGRVDVVSSTVAEGGLVKSQLLQTLDEGTYFNELALLQVPPKHLLAGNLPPGISGRFFSSPVSFIAYTNCEVLTLTSTDAAAILLNFPEVQMKLDNLAEKHLNQLNEAASRVTRGLMRAKGRITAQAYRTAPDPETTFNLPAAGGQMWTQLAKRVRNLVSDNEPDANQPTAPSSSDKAAMP